MDVTPVLSTLLPTSGISLEGLSSLKDSIISKLFGENVFSSAGAAKLPPSKLLQTAKTVDQIAQESFKPFPFHVTGPVPNLYYVAGGVVGAQRAEENLRDILKGHELSPAYTGLSMISDASVLTGYVGMCKSYQNHHFASHINDVWGKIYGKINFTKGAFEALSGIVMIPARAITLAATHTTNKVSALAANNLSKIGGVGSIISVFLIALPCLLRAGQLTSFRSKFARSMKEDTGAQFLREQLEIPHNTQKKVAEKIVNQRKAQKEGVVVHPDDEALLSNSDRGYIDGYVRFQGFDDLTAARVKSHLTLAFVKEKKHQKAKLSRMIGEKHLSHFLSGSKTDQAWLQQVHKEITFNLRFNAFAGLVCLGAVGAMIAGVVLTGGAALLPLAIVGVVTTLAALAADGYGLYQSYKKGQLSTRDRVIFAAIVLLMAVSVSSGIVFSGGIAPLVVSTVVGLIWLGLSAYSYRRWSANTDKAHEEAIQQMKKVANQAEQQKLAS